MGNAILELVLRSLREAGFPADAAFPGQKIPAITEPVAAVHIEKVDSADLTVTVEVSVLCPAQMGGARCEREALRAMEALCLAGADCILEGCEYNGHAKAWSVRILASFLGIATADDCTMGPDFRVYVKDQVIPSAVSFEAEQVFDVAAQYQMGEDAPVGILSGSWVWKLRLEELIPPGEAEVQDPEPDFAVLVERGEVAETYCHCRWISVRREFTRQGLRLIRTGISTHRQEGVYG